MKVKRKEEILDCIFFDKEISKTNNYKDIIYFLNAKRFFEIKDGIRLEINYSLIDVPNKSYIIKNIDESISVCNKEMFFNQFDII